MKPNNTLLENGKSGAIPEPRPEKYGKIISLEEAKNEILRHSKLGEIFLKAYDQYIRPVVGIKFRDWFVSGYYIIGKARDDENIEGTLRVKNEFQFFYAGCSMDICLEYDGNDTKFEPRVPKEPNGLLYKLGLKEVKKPGISENFPLYNKEYGARIFLSGGSYENPGLNIELKDRTLTKWNEMIYASIQNQRRIKG